MAADQRTPGADVVDVTVAIGIPYQWPLAALEKKRRAADGFECTHRRIDAAGNGELGMVEQFLAFFHQCNSNRD